MSLDEWYGGVAFKDYRPSSDWIMRCESICNAPVRQSKLPEIPADHPTSLFNDYWLHLRGDRVAPRRADLRPADIKPILKWLFIFDRQWEQETPRYRVRLQGTAVCDLCHGNYQGSYLDSFTSTECYASRAAMFRAAIETCTPQYAAVLPSLAWSDERQAEFRLDVSLGAFPFCSGETEVDQLIVVVAPKDEDMRLCL
ncbi:MAG: PAS domain-containing protein [Rhodothalassiaceae bacterium]